MQHTNISSIIIVYNLLINSASSDTALFPSTLVALHRYLPSFLTAAVFVVKILLTPLLCTIFSTFPELYCFLFLSQVTFNELLLPLTKHSNVTLCLLLTICSCGSLWISGRPAV